MLRTQLAFAVAALCLFACTAPPPATPAPEGWRCCWSDEFDHDGAPDPQHWDYEVGRVRNQELQYYTADRPANARVEDGNLVIEAIREPFDGATHTSASLITKGKAGFTHARIEVRARLPEGRGVWPAIWLLGTDIDQVGWPACGEVDIMEYVGFDQDAIFHNVHCADYNHTRGNGRGTRVPLHAPYGDFHVYAVEWDRERMRFFLDGDETFAVDNDHTGAGAWPFDQPLYLILNLAVGGSWGGQQGVDESIFPQRLVIDWVRVYTPAP